MLALTALALVPRWLLGFLVIDLIRQGRAGSRVLQFFLAGAVGVGISSMLGFLWIWAGLGLRLYSVIETAVVVAAFAVWAWRRRAALRWARTNLRQAVPRDALGWLAALGTAALAFTAVFWGLSLRMPHGSWDAWVHWNVVSRFVYRGGEEWRGTFQRIYDEPDYPLLLAMSNASTWELVQKETTRGPMALAFLYTGSLAGLLFGLVREVRGTPQACLSAMVLLSQPLLLQTGIAQYADVPAAFYFLASAGLTLLYVRSRERSMCVLAGLAAGLGAWTKNEGLVFAAIGLAAWAAVSWRERSPVIKYFLYGAAGPLAVLGLFKVFLAPMAGALGNPQIVLQALSNPDRYLVVLREVGQAFWDGAAGPAPWGIALAAYAILIGRTRHGTTGVAYLLLMLAAQAGGYFLAYVGTPHAYGTAAMIPTSLGRLEMHVLPLLVAALFLWLKSPAELSPGDGVEMERAVLD